jgi:hypothetical protein
VFGGPNSAIDASLTIVVCALLRFALPLSVGGRLSPRALGLFLVRARIARRLLLQAPDLGRRNRH